MSSLLVISSSVMTIMPLFMFGFIVFVVILITVGSNQLAKLRHWSKQLEHRTLHAHEFSELLADLTVFKRMHNRPAVWSMCKTIYFGVYRSNELTLDEKVKIYDVFDRLGLHGIPYPKSGNPTKRPTTIHDMF